MWSPEGRKHNAEELRKVADKVLRYRQLCDRFAGYFQADSDNGRQLRTLRVKLEDLRARLPWVSWISKTGALSQSACCLHTFLQKEQQRPS